MYYYYYLLNFHSNKANNLFFHVFIIGVKNNQNYIKSVINAFIENH